MEKKIMKIYNKVLKQIESMLGTDGSTYTDQLNKIGKEILGDKYVGTFSSDKIPQLTDKHPYAIINLDDSSSPGSHWVAIAQKNNIYYVYDSFGRKSSTILPSLKGGKFKIKDSDRDVEQDILEENCGQRSMSWIVVFDQFGKKLALLI